MGLIQDVETRGVSPQVSRSFELTSSREARWSNHGSGASSAGREGAFQSLRQALGLLGSVVIMASTVTTLGVMGFLVFLWTGEGSDEGEKALPAWRFLVLGQWITQAITLSSDTLRIFNAAQASVCTGLIAALVLERYGVPLSRLAEYSLIRSNNDGPLRLSWLLLSSLRKAPALPTFMAMVLLSCFAAVQFTSTILVSDLGSSTIVGDARNDSRGVSASFDTLNQFHIISQYYLKPSFQAFGESPGSDFTPTAVGVSDTGIVKRIHPFVPQANRTTLRQYEGKTFVFNSRIVCLRPSIDDILLNTNALNNPSVDLDFVPYLTGKVAYEITLQNADISIPEDCPSATCFPSAFNCSIGIRTGITGRQALSGCIPSGRNAVPPSYNTTITNDPIANSSGVFIFTRSNILFNTTFNNTFDSQPVGVSEQDEWTTYSFNNGVSLDISLCFQQLHYDRADVQLSTNQNLEDATVSWNANATTWDTSAARRPYGNETTKHDDAARGIYSVNDLKNISRSSTTLYLTKFLRTDGYESIEKGNVSINLSPYSGGTSDLFPHVEYQALFADMLEETNRPAFAFQSLTTALSGSVIDGLLPQLDIMESVNTISSVSVQVPQRPLGLALVLSINCINLMIVVVIVSLFLTRTECTSQGSYWHAVAQIASGPAEAILHQSIQATDDEVEEMLKDHNIEVKLDRRGFSGRVEIVKCEKPEDYK